MILSYVRIFRSLKAEVIPNFVFVLRFLEDPSDSSIFPSDGKIFLIFFFSCVGFHPAHVDRSRVSFFLVLSSSLHLSLSLDVYIFLPSIRSVTFEFRVER